ncbi:MAG: FliM/FliN family flagellar motor switch protein [Syntrophomonadaceae bacterium]|nr:FliM/FliN family flagellar motor switch protein [Syntrophomonadaceae bacterium]
MKPVLTEAEIHRIINKLHLSSGPRIAPVQFLPLEPGPLRGNKVPLSHVADIGVTVAVQLGRTSLTIKEILALEAGATITLESLVGEPADILVNEQLLGKGEVLVINDSFGVRVTALAEVKE